MNCIKRLRETKRGRKSQHTITPCESVSVVIKILRCNVDGADVQRTLACLRVPVVVLLEPVSACTYPFILTHVAGAVKRQKRREREREGAADDDVHLHHYHMRALARFICDNPNAIAAACCCCREWVSRWRTRARAYDVLTVCKVCTVCRHEDRNLPSASAVNFFILCLCLSNIQSAECRDFVELICTGWCLSRKWMLMVCTRCEIICCAHVFLCDVVVVRN